MNPSENHSVLIVAGEASSASYAARLLKVWKEKQLDIKAFGVGSREMEALGFECLGRSEEMAVVGIQEVFREWNKISGAFKALEREAEKRKPKFALLLDYPDFNLLLAKRLKKLGIKVIYYISPQVWAWRKGRVKTIRKYVDKMLVLLPFEVDFYKKNNVDAEFVGHPILDEMHDDLWNQSKIEMERARYGLTNDRLVLGLMPGSRRSEIHHHLLVQIEVARRLIKEFPKLQVALLVAPTLTVEQLQSQLGNIEFPIVLIKKEPFEMIALTDVVLCASGTATLMVGLMKKPMVIMYIVNWLSKIIGETLVRNLKHFGLSNIVLERRQSVELKNDEATLERLTQEMKILIQSEEVRKSHREGLGELHTRLGSKGASERVSQILERYL